MTVIPNERHSYYPVGVYPASLRAMRIIFAFLICAYIRVEGPKLNGTEFDRKINLLAVNGCFEYHFQVVMLLNYGRNKKKKWDVNEAF